MFLSKMIQGLRARFARASPLANLLRASGATTDYGVWLLLRPPPLVSGRLLPLW